MPGTPLPQPRGRSRSSTARSAPRSPTSARREAAAARSSTARSHEWVAVAPLLARFRAHAPERLALYHGVAGALQALRARVAIGVVTDGDPTIQRNKIKALGLESRVDIVVLSDELGREHRKPSPVPLLAALTALGVDARDAIFVGDRPEKDMVAAAAAGMRGIRVRTGEYARRPDVPQPWATAPDVVTAIEGILELSAAAAV